MKPFKTLVEHINPNIEDLKHFNSNTKNFTIVNKILKETVQFVNENSLNKFHCKCNSFYDFDKQMVKNKTEKIQYFIRSNPQ